MDLNQYGITVVILFMIHSYLIVIFLTFLFNNKYSILNFKFIYQIIAIPKHNALNLGLRQFSKNSNHTSY
jgi:hypothetical protein